MEFPLHIIHKPDRSVSAVPFDESFRVNAKLKEFDPQVNQGDCTFQIKKEGFW